ncbi:hypothetical protein JTB14_030003 [Gonioctena quinquepunctata]|nr:hypothetical protein JTB14_030003 [Gonioctena quinquepunctata]
MWKQGILVFTLFVGLGYSAGSEDSELLSVAVLYRHGDRSPQKLYPTDPNAEISSTVWPDGIGRITNEGKIQHYALGQFLRKRYNGFLSEKYDYNEFILQSSTADICLMSASANLAGLYPPVGEQIWNPDLPWMPIPIHSFPKEYDSLLAVTRDCPKLQQLLTEIDNSEWFKAYWEEHRELVDYLTKNSGTEIKSPMEHGVLYDALYVETVYNLTIPEWAKSVFPDKMTPLYDFQKTLATTTPELCKLSSGHLIDYITSHFENVSKNVTGTQKFLMLSGHESTIIALLDTLQIYNKLDSPYAAAVIFELRRRGSDEFINILYKDKTYGTDLLQLTIPSCGFDCKVDAFEDIVKPFRVTAKQWDEECADTN